MGPAAKGRSNWMPGAWGPFDPEGNQLSLDAGKNLILRSLVPGQQGPALRLNGSGQVTLQQLSLPLLQAEGGQVRLFAA